MLHLLRAETKALGSIWRARLSGRIGSTYVPATSKNDSNTKRFIPDLFFINRSESGFSGLGFRTMADAGFVDELVRRDSEIWSGETMSSPEERAEIYDYYARIRSFRIPDLSGQTSFIEKIDRQISRYYKPGEEIRSGADRAGVGRGLPVSCL